MPIRDRYRAFLRDEVHTDQVKHSGRTLYDHLCGTHALLERWGNREAVCDAGLFHSIYGTNAFRLKSWPLTERATIQALIGYEAELLVYSFATLDRPGAFFTPPQTSTQRALREIEAANLIEQGGKSKWLWWLAESEISAGAIRDLREVIGALPVRQ